MKTQYMKEQYITPSVMIVPLMAESSFLSQQLSTPPVEKANAVNEDW